MSSANLETLLAEREIVQVLRRYCRSMDRIDAALGYTVWHEGGLANYGPIFTGTGRGFIDWVCEFHRGLDKHHHQIGNALIDVQGDRAGSETYITVNLLFRKDGKQMLTTGFGRYLDRWSRRNGRWAIDERNYANDFSFTREVEAQIGWSARDLTDPSYAVLGALGAG